ncbi:MAG: coenzyme F420-0:L-glutamate ligase [Candidatus Saccharimonadales bacterium]
MIAQSIKTQLVSPGSCTLFELLDASLKDIPEGSVLAITSKIVSLCEGSTVPIDGTDKMQLVRDQADYYMGERLGKYAFNFTITQDTLIPNSGIDESNAGDVYVLWPRDSQATANAVRQYLVDRFKLKNVGVIITDSTCRPLRRGVSGIALSFSGFMPLHNYVGQDDLFGRPFAVAQADIVGGLANTAVMMMGEGAESTPLALMSDLGFVDFVSRDPSDEELASLHIPLEDDVFEPFLNGVEWLPGKKNS